MNVELDGKTSIVIKRAAMSGVGDRPMIRAMKNSVGQNVKVSLALAVLFVIQLGGAPVRAQEAKEKEKSAPKPIPESIEKRLSAIERHVSDLDEASKSLRKQLDQIEASREALKINATNLRAELSGAEPVKAGENVKSAVKTGEPMDKAEHSPERVGFIRFIFQFIFVSLIVGCVFIIVRIFISRWNEHEPEAMVEKETGLGTIRHPAMMESVPDKIAPSESSAESARAGANEEEQSIDFKNPSDAESSGDGKSGGEKTSNKDYY